MSLLLAKELKRAMDAGIYVVQVNMASNTLTDAYVGVDAKDMGAGSPITSSTTAAAGKAPAKSRSWKAKRPPPIRST